MTGGGAEGNPAVPVLQYLDGLLDRLAGSCSRKQTTIRDACETARAHLKSSDTSDNPNVLSARAIEVSMPPLLSTLEAQQAPKQQLIALQGLERIFSHPGTESDAHVENAVSVIAQAGRESIDEPVQLQVMNVLRCAILNPDCFVHGQALMMAVRACYQIYLSGVTVMANGNSSAGNQRCKLAHSILSDILTTVFERMECAASQLTATAHHRHEDSINSTAEMPTDDLEESAMSADDDIIVSAVLDRLVGLVEQKLSDGSGVSEETSPDAGTCEAKVSPESGVSCRSKSEPAADRVSAQSGVPVEDESEDAHLRKTTALLQNDAFLLFRSLCKLSDKPLVSEDDDVAIRSKSFSLVLLNEIIVHSGHHFRSSRRFLNGIRVHLVKSLFKNCVSPVHAVFQLALQLFVSIIQCHEFKVTLKTEIGVLLDSVILGVAESQSSSAAHRLSVLRMLRKAICSQKDVVFDLFLNYDCDTGGTSDGASINVYEHMCKILESSANSLSGPPDNRLEAVQCIDELLRALLAFHDDAAPDTVAAASDSSIEASAGSGSRGGSPKHASMSGGGGGAWDIVSSKFERKREVAADLQAGIVKFNLKPKAGLAYLHEKGIVDSTSAAEVAKFLHSAKSLDKQAIGEFLGGHQPFNREVLYAYVDIMSFHDSHIDTALRKFLQGFRLPGESQIIDRMMEKFAERYCACNPGAFSTADCAYVLAYAIIMLNTDAHNPMLKDKDRMSKEQFVNNNRGIDGGKDLPREFMTDIYDRIVNNEIKMHTALSAPSGSAGLHAVDDFHKDAERLMEMTRNLLSAVAMSSGSASYLQISAQDRTIVQPMFSVLWAPVLVVCSMQLQGDHISSDTVRLCMSIYRVCIRLSSRFNMHVQRAAFINSLAAQTLLAGAPTSAPMQFKNIEAVRVLLGEIALQEGDYIRESWSTILRCISELDRLHMIGSGAHSDEQFFDAPASGSVQTSTTDAVNSASLAANFETSVIDRIFSRSASLSAEAIVHFVDELCAVSATELVQNRVFSLQKLVEITYYNMNRIRLVWSRIWSPISSHLTRAGQHPNLKVAIYAIDSLRQLANKFLEKDELSRYEFQVQFLKPFDSIMRWTASPDIREFIVQCLSRLVLSRADNVKSGWRIVWSVFEEAARDSPLAAASLTLETATRLLHEHGDVVMKGSIDEVPVEIVQCLIAFVESRHTDLSLQAIALLEFVAHHLHRISSEMSTGDHSDSSLDVDGTAPRHGSLSSEPVQSMVGIWLLALTGLSKAVGDARPEVRTRALSVLHAVLRELGKEFSVQTWRMLFKVVLIPMFDDVVKDPIGQRVGDGTGSGDDGTSFAEAWFSTTCAPALSVTIDVLSENFSQVSFELPNVLRLLSDVTCAGSRRHRVALAEIGINGLVRLMGSCAVSLSPDAWTSVLQTMCYITSVHCGGSANFTSEASSPAVSPSPRSTLLRSSVLQRLITMTEQAVFQYSKYWDVTQCSMLSSALDRVLMWMSTIPALARDACACVNVIISLSVVMLGNEVTNPSWVGPRVAEGTRIFVTISSYLMKHFILSEPSFPEYEAERHVVCQLLASLTQMPDSLLTTMFMELHPIVFDLVMVRDQIVRVHLHRLLSRLLSGGIMKLSSSSIGDSRDQPYQSSPTTQDWDAI
ncbi:unnamed protein product (mitochondrion) [Plasmodiophora brassicae]|uniref:SEC7 domain-containing protein n=1 Tax=Plasmodiophora brassicae TaxID=37360 RepID=A0A0G4J3X5_PLABS|nr:hypothetical protein PBRA_002519 [Plasmodiophora brassicae]SPQ93566.1 unnamed protein product [Plasmodiophora brassicae]